MVYEDVSNNKTGHKCVLLNSNKKGQVNKLTALDYMVLLTLDLMKGYCLAVECESIYYGSKQ